MAEISWIKLNFAKYFQRSGQYKMERITYYPACQRVQVCVRKYRV